MLLRKIPNRFIRGQLKNHRSDRIVYFLKKKNVTGKCMIDDCCTAVISGCWSREIKGCVRDDFIAGNMIRVTVPYQTN